jgi:hypothetical protein
VRNNQHRYDKEKLTSWQDKKYKNFFQKFVSSSLSLNCKNYYSIDGMYHKKRNGSPQQQIVAFPITPIPVSSL